LTRRRHKACLAGRSGRRVERCAAWQSTTPKPRVLARAHRIAVEDNERLRRASMSGADQCAATQTWGIGLGIARGSVSAPPHQNELWCSSACDSLKRRINNTMTETPSPADETENTDNTWTEARKEFPNSETAKTLEDLDVTLKRARQMASTPSSSSSGSSSSFILSSIDRITNADPRNVQEIAGSQLELLTGYHEIALAQSRRSFFWALLGAGAGFVFFLAATGFVLATGKGVYGVIPAISGAIVETMAGVVFYLYAKTTTQLGDFHSRLETLQRYLLANSICESLADDDRSKVRSDLIREIARVSAAA
jgi:hypothetical protein